MKNQFICIVLGIFSASVFAQTCPPENQVFQNGKVVLPPGWELKGEPRITSDVIGFMVAGWGDHHSEATPVSCYYFNRSHTSHIYIQSSFTVPRSKIISHFQWNSSPPDDRNYYICGDYDDYHDVKSCPFN
jgi:hypothetical protein